MYYDADIVHCCHLNAGAVPVENSNSNCEHSVAWGFFALALTVSLHSHTDILLTLRLLKYTEKLRIRLARPI